MNSAIKENQSLIISGLVSLVLTGAGGYYLYSGMEQNHSAFEELQKVNQSLVKAMGINPSPNEENLKELNRQKEEAAEAVTRLTQELKALDMALDEQLTPTDFQKQLNEKVQSLAKLAETNSVQLPQNFYLNFEKYSKTVPKQEVTPQLGRQLSVASLITEKLIQNVPQEIRSFERQELELEKDSSSQPKEATPSKDKDKKKDKDKPPEKPKQELPPQILSGQSFKIAFLTRPANLREFINQIVSEKSCILVIRSLKVANEKQKGPSKAGPDLTQAGADATATKQSDSMGQFILGDEKIEASMQIELVSFLPESAKRP